MVKDQRDHYYWKAKEDGDRAVLTSFSRSIKVQPHQERRLRRGPGSAPGGWLQVAKELSAGKIVGVDCKGQNPYLESRPSRAT